MALALGQGVKGYLRQLVMVFRMAQVELGEAPERSSRDTTKRSEGTKEIILVTGGSVVPTVRLRVRS